jgi:hypothetical protein
MQTGSFFFPLSMPAHRSPAAAILAALAFWPTAADVSLPSSSSARQTQAEVRGAPGLVTRPLKTLSRFAGVSYGRLKA